MVSSTRQPHSNSKQLQQRRPQELPTSGRIELDSHADTIVLGSNCVVLHHTGKVCKVSPYSDDYEAIKNVPVVCGATLWTDTVDNQEYILMFNESLWMGDSLTHSLINPSQLRAFGTDVQDNPFSNERLSIQPALHDITIPLQTLGTIIYANTRAPTDQELGQHPHIVLSSTADWDPHHVRFPYHAVEEESRSTINAIQTGQQYCVEPSFVGSIDDPATFAERLISSVQVNNPNMDKADVPSAQTFHTKERKTTVNAAELSERWFIGLAQAEKTIRSTTQRLLRSAILPLVRRYRADRMYERPRFRGTVYTDMMHGHFKSLDGNRYAQVFATENFFAAAYPMEAKSMAGDALKEFITEFGVPDKVVMDGAAEQTGRKTTFMQQVRKHHIDFHLTKPERYNQSQVEGVIREIRKKWFRVMMKRSVPKRLWDYGLRWVVEIMQRTASSAGNLHDRTSLEKVTGETPEISEYVDFSFYDWCWYKENAGMGETKLGRWLGVSHRTGSLMSFWVLTQTCKVVSRTSVQRVTRLEMGEEDTQKRTGAFDEKIKLRLRDHTHTLEEDGKVEPLDWSTHPYGDDPDFQEEFNSITSNAEIKDDDNNFTPDTYDMYLNMELALPQGDSLEPRMARVTKRLKDANSIPIGTADDNPL